MASVAVAFAALALIPLRSFPGNLLPPLVFAGLPLLVLGVLVGRHWTALFRRVGWREVGVMALFAIATMAASLLAALVVRALDGVAPNPVTAAMMEMSAGAFVLRLLPTLPQLLGEEILTILPFLALLWFATQVLRLSRRAGILVGLIGSSLIFAAVHLPTYDWHWAQCLGVIGTARVILTLAYIWTRNLWVSTGAHVLNDWTEFSLAFGMSHVPIGTD
ncbi:CPBP family intramembrane glutamic endopeptidase [Falsiroseomonas frigidaquae]|nr:CPBP family intramembrane glutamic endopeptidase [Falsiroseomonas frigidaquae]